MFHFKQFQTQNYLEMANYYVTSDDSFDKYMAMRGNFKRINKPKSSSIK